MKYHLRFEPNPPFKFGGIAYIGGIRSSCGVISTEKEAKIIARNSAISTKLAYYVVEESSHSNIPRKIIAKYLPKARDPFPK